MTEEELIKWVKARLGYPVIQVEVPDDTIKLCIDDAIQEVEPWYNERRYVTVPVAQCIDLKELAVGDVVRCIKSESSGNSSSEVIDSQSNTHSLTQSFFGTVYVYSPRSYGIQNSASYMQSYLENMLQSQSNTYLKDNISFTYDSYEHKLYLDIGTPSSSAVTLEYIPKLTLDVSDSRYLKFIKDFTLAYVREVLGEMRGKFRISNSPTELDYDHQYDKSSSELERLRQALRDEFIDDCSID